MERLEELEKRLARVEEALGVLVEVLEPLAKRFADERNAESGKWLKFFTFGFRPQK